jgi:hypothetical protein
VLRVVGGIIAADLGGRRALEDVGVAAAAAAAYREQFAGGEVSQVGAGEEEERVVRATGAAGGVFRHPHV